jgi:LPS export ABC transporter protein LptC
MMRPPLVNSVRRILFGIVILVILVVLFNYLYAWYRQSGISLTVPEMLDAEYMRSAESIEYFEHKNGVLRFRIKARQLLETRRGKSLLDGIEAWDFDAAGAARNAIRSDKAEYDRDGKLVDFFGNVRLYLGNDIELHTPTLHYDLTANVGTTSDTMHLFSGDMSGTAHGIYYDQDRELLLLDSDVSFLFKPENGRAFGRNNSGTVRVTSRKGTSSMVTQELVFEGNARLDTDHSGTLHGDKIEIILSPDRTHITSLISIGQAEYQFGESGETRILRGDTMNFSIGSTGELEKISVSGQASLLTRSFLQEEHLHAAVIDVIPDTDTGGIAEIHGKTGVEFRMKRGREETTASGEYLKAVFFPVSGRLRQVQIRDQAGFSMTGSADASTNVMEADTIDVRFRDHDEQVSIENIHADGSVRWSLMSGQDAAMVAGSQSSQSLRASVLEIFYSDDTEYPESGYASGDVAITETRGSASLPNQLRRLEADAVRFRFFPNDTRVRELYAEGRVRILSENNPNPSTGQITDRFRTESDFLSAEFILIDDNSTIHHAAQWSNFNYRDAERTASAGRFDYFAEKNLLVFTDAPRILDEKSSTTGEYMEYDRTENRLLVRGNVQSVLGGQSGRGSFFHSPESSSPGIVTADELRYWTGSGRFRYAGRVQALSERQQLQAPVMDVYENGERLKAEGGIRHLLLSGPVSATSAGSSRDDPASNEITVIRSEDLNYEQKSGELKYSGNVHLTSKDLNLSSARLDVVLDEDGSDVRHAVARGEVTIRQENFMCSGDTADWHPDPGKLVVIGNPVEVHDPERGRSYARRLTYYQADDRILLE